MMDDDNKSIYLFNSLNPHYPNKDKDIFIISGTKIPSSHPEYTNLCRILEICKDKSYVMGANYKADVALYSIWAETHISKISCVLRPEYNLYGYPIEYFNDDLTNKVKKILENIIS